MQGPDPDVFLRAARRGDEELIRELIFGILAEFSLSPDPAGTDNDLFDLESSYFSRGGTFDILETPDGQIVGTVGLYPAEGSNAELRKMYLAQRMRGFGLGRRLLFHAIARARQLGFKSIYLETADVLESANHLYRSAGFVPCDTVHSARCDQGYVLDLTDTK